MRYRLMALFVTFHLLRGCHFFAYLYHIVFELHMKGLTYGPRPDGNITGMIVDYGIFAGNDMLTIGEDQW